MYNTVAMQPEWPSLIAREIETVVFFTIHVWQKIILLSIGGRFFVRASVIAEIFDNLSVSVILPAMKSPSTNIVRV